MIGCRKFLEGLKENILMAKKKLKGIPITPQMFLAQWKHASHKFQLNVWNFEVSLGKAAVEIFKQSFDMQRFNTKGSRPWRKRRKSYTHPILNETGTLKNSIEWKYLNDTGASKGGVRIYTNPSKFGTAARHAGFCYAAVHNNPSGSHTYGNTGVRSVQRQFMGHTSELDKKIKELTPKIFAGLP